MPGADLLLNSALVSALGWTLVHFLWQGCVIAFIFWLICLFSPRRASSLRYWAGLAGMLLSLLVMLLTFSLSYAPEAHFGFEMGAASAVNPFLVLSGSWPGAWSLMQIGLEPALPWIVMLWFIGVVLASMRTSRDWWGVHKLLHEGIQATEVQLQLALERLKAELDIQFPVRLLASSRVSVPLAVGWLRPVILMPVSVLARLPQDQLEMILAHELGHIRRFDYFFNLLQILFETVLFYHPAISWMSRRVRQERELRCDDLVVRTCGRPATYARALTNLEVIRSPSLDVAIPATGGNLLTRIKLIIDNESPGRKSLMLQFALAALAGAAVAFGAQQGYSLSAELNRVAISAQLQVSDVQWKTWGRSRDVWGQGVMGFAETLRRKQLADLKKQPLSLQNLLVPESRLADAHRNSPLSGSLLQDVSSRDTTVDGIPVYLADAILTSTATIRPNPKFQLEYAVAAASMTKAETESQSIQPEQVFTSGDESPAGELMQAAELKAVAAATQAELKAVISRLPNYPWRARRKGIEGFVELEFGVDDDGKVTDIVVLDAMPKGVFEKAASKALSRWTFESSDSNDSRHRKIFDFELHESEKLSPRQRSCIQTGSRTCGQISPGVYVVWVNNDRREAGGTGLN